MIIPIPIIPFVFDDDDCSCEDYYEKKKRKLEKKYEEQEMLKRGKKKVYKKTEPYETQYYAKKSNIFIHYFRKWLGIVFMLFGLVSIIYTIFMPPSDFKIISVIVPSIIIVGSFFIGYWLYLLNDDIDDYCKTKRFDIRNGKFIWDFEKKEYDEIIKSNKYKLVKTKQHYSTIYEDWE